MSLSVVLVAVGASAQAGPCTEDIRQFEEMTARAAATNPAAGPTAPESLDAKLRRQPTPESVQRAQASAQAGFSDLLARARALDEAGDQAGCSQALADARKKFERR